MKKIRFGIIIICVFVFTSCGITGRILLWNRADLDDYKKFPSRQIHKSVHSFHFYESSIQYHFDVSIPSELYSQGTKTFEGILKSDKTVAFLIIRNDSIIYENYFDGYSKSEIVNSFSVAKSFVSLLTGIAISEGYIKDVHVKITDYIPELQKKGFDKISIEDLLNMRSGIKFNDGLIIPYTNEATYYYGPDLLSYLKHLKIKNEPALNFQYKSVNTHLLSIIISRATKKTLSEYLQEKIWEPLGMESDAKWVIDHENGIERAFCCLNAVARDYAKLGRLCLYKGNWDGKQIVPEAWIEKCTHPSIIGENSYSYHFWLYKNNTYFANGFHGQYVFVNPNTNTIIVRIGDCEKKVKWLEMLYFLSEQNHY